MSAPLSPLARITALAPDGLPLSGPLIRAGLARAFGPPPFDAAAAPGDPGLFGPGSSTWEVIAEPAAIVGGIRALLVQLLHPAAMAGVAQHSRFRHDALDRLQRTSAYVTATAFGSTADALRAAAAVRRAHRRVAGTAPGGRGYRADDPDLLAWVSVALTSSCLATHRAYAPRPLTAARADRFVGEQSRAAALLDPRVDLAALADRPALGTALADGAVALPLVQEGRLPTTTDTLADAVRHFSGQWEVTHQGRETLRFLLWPELSPPMRAAYLPLLAGAVATLDTRQRQHLRLPVAVAAPAVRAQTRLTLTAMRLAAGRSPSLRAAQRRAAAAGSGSA